MFFLRVRCVFRCVLCEPPDCIIKGFTKDTNEDTTNTTSKLIERQGI